MKVHFQIFKAPFAFVGWQAPAYGKDEVNPNGITKGKESRTMKACFQSSRLFSFRRMAGASLRVSNLCAETSYNCEDNCHQRFDSSLNKRLFHTFIYYDYYIHFLRYHGLLCDSLTHPNNQPLQYLMVGQ